MEKKYILMSLDDEKAKKLADVLGNKTSNKIIDLLAEKELSEKDIAEALKIPMNTVEYNLKKLLDADLIERSKSFFWSQKGKKIDIYKVSNKSIIISPKKRISSGIRSVIPVAIVSGIFAVALKYYLEAQELARNSVTDISVKSAPTFAEASSSVTSTTQNIILYSNNEWIWFLAGALFALAIFTLLNWRKL